MMLRWYDAGLARRLGQAAKERAKRSGVKGFRRRWWSGSRPSGRNAFLILWLGSIGVRLVVQRLGQMQGTEAVTGCVTLALAGVALQRMKQLRKALTMSFERVQSYFYPVSESEFVTRTLIRAGITAWWLPAAGLAIFRMLQPGNSAGVWATAVLAAIAEFFVVLTLVYALERYLEVIPGWLSMGFFGMAGLWLFTPQDYAAGQQKWVNALPTGWANLLLTSSWPAEIKIAALGGMVGVFGVATWYFARARRGALIQGFEETIAVETQSRAMEMEERAGMPSETWRALGEPSETRETGITGFDDEEPEVVQPLPMQATWQRQRIESIGQEWSAAVREGSWLQRWDWSQMPWIERAVGWWLDDAEKDTFWFLVGGRVPRWSNSWKNSVIALAVGVSFAALLPANWRWLGVIAILLSLGLALPLAGGTWMATSPGWISGKLSPIYGVYPLAYGRASRVMAKVNLVRTAAWLPLGAVLTVVDARLSNEPMGATYWLAARVALLWLAWIPITIAGQFSKGTNDTTLLRAKQLLVIPVVIVVVSALIVFWGAILVNDSPMVLIGAAGAIAASVGLWAAYGWWYNRKVDLLRDRQ